jgi:uncharacterized protein (TIGR02466 family)
MAVENWFPTPVYYNDLVFGEYSPIQQEIFENLEKMSLKDLSNPFNDTVKTTFKHGMINDVVSEFALTHLYKMIEKCAIEFCNTVKYDGTGNTNYKIKVIESWINFYNRNDYQFDHEHTGDISGVYYYQSNGNDGDIVFSNPHVSTKLQRFPSNSFSKSIYYKPRIGKIVLFPSWLTHRVEPNKTDDTRISIAFNLKIS